MQRIAIEPPLTAPYDGPYKVIHRVNLPRPLTPYVAPHSRTPAVSRANGSDGGLRTYPRVPLHLRGRTPNTPDTPEIPDVRNNPHIAESDKIISDTTVKQTRVGREINTPARFVQIVHAKVAPNDIYRGTNFPYRNNHNL